MKIVNKKRFIGSIIITICAILLTILMVDVIRFPECYSPIAKRNLHLDISNGNELAIEYYERNYVANGRELFE